MNILETIANDLEQVPNSPAFAAMELWLSGDDVWPRRRIVEEWGGLLDRWPPGLDDWKVNNTVSAFAVRSEFIRRYGFAIPCKELLDALAKIQPIVEIGAGTGYLTRLMRNRGVNVTGSDSRDGGYKFAIAAHDPQQVTAQGKTMVRRYPDATIFCSWPSLDETWFRQALKAMKIGQRLIVIRESACAEDSAWSYLDDCFEQQGAIGIPMFWGMHDHGEVHIKKRQNPKQ